MSSTHYVVEVETTTRGTDDAAADRWVGELEPWHGVVTTNAGHLVVLMTLPAENLAQATATGLAIVERLGTPLVVTVQPEDVRDAREGWAPMPELLSVAEAAAHLNVSRQRVLQMIDEGKLPARKVGSTNVIPASAVHASSAE